MTALWTWRELCRALGIAEVDGPDINGVAIDSRRIRPGELFVALPGDPGPRFNPSHRSERDGHDFVDAALANGAAGVLTHDGRARQLPQLQVADTLDGLWALGAAARARLRGPVVAVTGSSGKTTVKGLLGAALNGFTTSGSLNNHLGVPWSLALTPRDATAAIYEIGTNHPGEIGPLSRLARPDVAVVLNVHPAHRQNFANMAELTREKLSIHEGLTAHGTLVAEAGLDLRGVPADVPTFRFGEAAGARVRLLGLDGDDAEFEVDGEPLRARVPGGGRHRALSLAAVLGVLQVLERPLDAATTLPDSLIAAGRGQVHDIGGITVIDDSYNANPESMRAALVTLAARPGGRRFAVLGEMLELGDEGPAFHRALATQAAGLDGVICVGEGSRPLFDALPPATAIAWHPEADAALVERIRDLARPGDAWLVKGSNRVFWARDFVKRLLTTLGGA